MSDDFLNELLDEIRAAYHPPPRAPVEELWRAVGERKALRDAYNAPGSTPREAIWAGVQARRAGAGVSDAAPFEDAFPAVAAFGASGVPRDSGAGRDAGAERDAPVAGRTGREGTALPPRYRRLRWALPAAATLLIGIAMGRAFPFGPAAQPADEAPDGAPVEAAPPVTSAAAPAAGPGSPTEAPRGTETPADGRLAGGDAASPDRREPGDTPFEAAQGNAANEGVDSNPGEGAAPHVALVAARDEGRDAAPIDRAASVPRPGTARAGLYRVAALETLEGAEALLAAVVASRPGDGDKAAAALADWGDEMLGKTRLLLDSPAAEDASLRVLLEDLELVLAQLVRLGEGNTAEGDVALIENVVQDRQILYRIRALRPAQPITSGT